MESRHTLIPRYVSLGNMVGAFMAFGESYSLHQCIPSFPLALLDNLDFHPYLDNIKSWPWLRRPWQPCSDLPWLYPSTDSQHKLALVALQSSNCPLWLLTPLFGPPATPMVFLFELSWGWKWTDFESSPSSDYVLPTLSTTTLTISHYNNPAHHHLIYLYLSLAWEPVGFCGCPPLLEAPQIPSGSRALRNCNLISISLNSP